LFTIEQELRKDLYKKVAAMREQRSNVIKGSDSNTRKPTRCSMKKAMVETEKPSE